jgi:hypothetical protein
MFLQRLFLGLCFSFSFALVPQAQAKESLTIGQSIHKAEADRALHLAWGRGQQRRGLRNFTANCGMTLGSLSGLFAAGAYAMNLGYTPSDLQFWIIVGTATVSGAGIGYGGGALLVEMVPSSGVEIESIQALEVYQLLRPRQPLSVDAAAHQIPRVLDQVKIKKELRIWFPAINDSEILLLLGQWLRRPVKELGTEWDLEDYFVRFVRAVKAGN